MDIGESSYLTTTITEDEVSNFASVSRDFNPIHLDEAYASQSIFGRRIVHGMLVASYISAVLANQLPGPGTIYLSQSLQFMRPVFHGDSVTAIVTVEECLRPSIWRLTTDVLNQDRLRVIGGEAIVKWSAP